jgi:hypothetical protein
VNPAEHTGTPSPTRRTGILATLRTRVTCALRVPTQGTRAPSSWLLAPAWILATALALFASAAPALATGDANNLSCPAATEASPGFSTSLPDCRAYEQVSPVFKDGTELEPHALSEDGQSLIAHTLGGFAGTESDPGNEGAEYLLARSPVGWTAQTLSPPSSAFPAQQFITASPDLSRTLWETRTPSESIAGQNFYLRESDGAMTRIGSLIPPSITTGPPSGEYQGLLYLGSTEFRGASADLSHVVFSLVERGGQNVFWPGDTTVGVSSSSLYEYVGTGQTRPELVGVDNEGNLISPCSTWLGSSGSQDVYNAVSADGATVYFTAEQLKAGCSAIEAPKVNELYGRLDGIQTIAISEPSAQDCSACDTSVKAPAEFAGASQDGSKVFFLTTQKLLAGAGSGMNLYEYDFDAPAKSRVTLVSTGSEAAEVQGVSRVSEDGSHTYFVARGRLGEGPRGGRDGSCSAEATPAEKAEEAIAEEQEEKSEPVSPAGKCRPLQGADNLYVAERDATYPAGRVSFVATLCTGEEASGELLTGVAQCQSPESDEPDWTIRDSRPIQTTPDGQFLVLQTTGELTEGESDTSKVEQVYEYDAATEALVRASKERPGLTPTEEPAVIREQNYFASASPAQANTELAVSGDGSIVLFSSKGALTLNAEPATGREEAENTYEYRSSVASGGSITAGGVYLLSGGSAELGRGAKGLDASGQDVFFETTASLVPQDTDTQLDTYDVRSDGGFLAPDPPPGCEAEACGSSLYTSPAAAAPVSANIGASGDVGTSAVIASSIGTSKPNSISRPKSKSPTSKKCRKKRSRTSRLVCDRRAQKASNDRGTGR